MAAHLIAEDEVVEVKTLPVLIYGPPGAWKTSIAQTADKPFTLDFDKGIHRSAFRKAAMRFDAWDDVDAAYEHIERAETIVVDTVGSALDALGAQIIADDKKAGDRLRGLNQKGYGILGNTFNQWMKGLLRRGKDVVLIAHATEDKDVQGNRFMRPAMTGNMAYNDLTRALDLWGYILIGETGQRVLDFSPTSQYVGKNVANFEPIRVPPLAEAPTFLADLLRLAKERVGQTAAASAARAKAVADVEAFLKADPNLEQIHNFLPSLGCHPKGTKRVLWAVVTDHCARQGYAWNTKATRFEPTAPGEPAA